MLGCAMHRNAPQGYLHSWKGESLIEKLLRQQSGIGCSGEPESRRLVMQAYRAEIRDCVSDFTCHSVSAQYTGNVETMIGTCNL